MMAKIAGFLLILTGVSAYAIAGSPVPEIDPSSAGAALAVITGAVLIIRDRRKR